MIISPLRPSLFSSRLPTHLALYLPRHHLSTSTSLRSSPSRTDDLKRALWDTMDHPGKFEGTVDPGLRMLIFGKPGSGKGTLSARLVQKYDLHFISTGDVLRKEIMNGSEIGKEAEEIVKAGGLVSDELMLRIIQSELDKLHGKSWILDGFPRTLRQAGLLDSALNRQGRPLNMIIHLRVPDSVILQRISGESLPRWVHLPSGRTYSTVFNAPKVPGKDDVTGEPLTQRPDDTPEVFNKRLSAFYKSTSPLLTYFQDYHGQEYHEIAGSTSDEVRFARTFNYNAPDGDSDDRAASSSSHATEPTTNTTTTTTTLRHHADDTHDHMTDPCPVVPETSANSSSTNVEKIWPHLEALVDEYQASLRPSPTSAESEQEAKRLKEEVDEVRREADDLRDPDEPVRVDKA